MMSPSPAARRAVAAAALACLAGLPAACGSGSPSASPTKTVTVPASASGAGATAAASPSVAAAATASAAASGPLPCPTRDLRLKLGLSQGAAGSIYQVIDFTNIGTVSCTLYGYPGVSLTGGTPVKQIGLAAKEDPVSPRALVTLVPGGVGNAVLRLAQAGLFPAAKCVPVTSKYLQIYPPNQTTPVYLSYVTQVCSGPVQQLSIQVVRPGSGG
jgi:Domain of unknown function (DUF4232)